MWLRKLLAVAVYLVIFLAFVHLPVRRHNGFKMKDSNFPKESREPKNILIWNNADRIETSAFGVGHEAFVSARCPVDDCIIHTSKSALALDEYDAVIIHVREMTKMPNFQRRLNQRFIFLSQESPAYLPIEPSEFSGVFNWTMTYRHNSDIRLLYGRIKEKLSAPKTAPEWKRLKDEMHDLSKTNYTGGKSNLVAWMASHCDTSESLT